MLEYYSITFFDVNSPYIRHLEIKDRHNLIFKETKDITTPKFDWK